jgi:hypothetical protein
MINRDDRDKAASILRKFIDCEITNDEFSKLFPRSREDKAVWAIRLQVWTHYSDFSEHRLSGKNRPSTDILAMLERCWAFLLSNCEYRWPEPSFGLKGILQNLLDKLPQFKRTSGTGSVSQVGDENMWPFFSKEEYERFANMKDGHPS